MNDLNLPPLPALIKQLRTDAGLTQQQCADMLSVRLRQWCRYEAGENKMPPSSFELFKIKLALHKQRGESLLNMLVCILIFAALGAIMGYRI